MRLWGQGAQNHKAVFSSASLGLFHALSCPAFSRVSSGPLVTLRSLARGRLPHLRLLFLKLPDFPGLDSSCLAVFFNSRKSGLSSLVYSCGGPHRLFEAYGII